MSSREHLKQYCLRALGAPVVNINIAEEQLQDRIDEALSYWNLYHYEGAEKVYLQHKITCSKLKVTSNGLAFNPDIDIRGTTSGATAKTQRGSDATTVMIRNVKGAFLAGENITDGNGVTATLSSTNFYTAGDTENHWIPIPDSVYGIVRVVPFTTPGQSSTYLFDIQYQLMLNDVRNLTSTDLVYYTQAMSHLDLLSFQLNAVPDFEFNRMQGQLRLDVNWTGKLMTGQVIVVEAYRALDPNQFSKVWMEPWLRQYTTALFKRQWGINLKKFTGMKLPGGLTVDGNTTFQEALLDIKQLETDLLTKAAPLGFFMG